MLTLALLSPLYQLDVIQDDPFESLPNLLGMDGFCPITFVLHLRDEAVGDAHPHPHTAFPSIH